MFKPRPCGCKGIRTCLVCEVDFGIEKVSCEPDNDSLKEALEFCHLCGDKAWPGQDVWKDHLSKHTGVGEEGAFLFPGVYLQPDFITVEEEEEMVAGCDAIDWDLSQSGRRKQNFGPKTNFKKKKIAGKSFKGFPAFSEKFQKKLRETPILSDFITIEQCAIEYKPETGACIDPHIDDCWVWGERVVSVSLLSSSVLTMNKFTGTNQKYNLDFHYNTTNSPPTTDISEGQENLPLPIVRIPMPQRSLLVLFGPARYAWEHSVLRKDITARRICMAYREFTSEYLPTGAQYETVGKDIITKASQFFYGFLHDR